MAELARYLFRFDDICPTMNWRIWSGIESVLVEHGIKPILAVVPDNQDPKLMPDPPAPDFWERVRAWQSRGWAIGLHGYQHLYVNESRGIMKLSAHSEFAELSESVQKAKLKAGLDIFAREGVAADCWIAPSHSFDWTTVEALRSLGVKVISDGLWPRPFTDRNDTVWIPQQMWDHPSEESTGVWTTCYHHNGWKENGLDRFRKDVEKFADRSIGLPAAIEIARGRRRSLSDRSFAWRRLFWRHQFGETLGKMRAKLSK